MKGKVKEEQINSELEPATPKSDLFLPPCRDRHFSTDGGVGVSGLLPLSLEIVGTCISRLTTGALRDARGVAGGRQKTRAVGRFEDLVFWKELVFLDGNPRLMELGVGRYRQWFTGPLGWSYGP